jgi:hypothetical protein
VDGVVEVFVEQRTEEDRSCFERKRASLPRANEQHHPDCAFPQLAPGQPIHMASCPVCTLASAFSPCPYHISQSRPLPLAAVMEAAGSEGYMAREQIQDLVHISNTNFKPGSRHMLTSFELLLLVCL